MRRALIVASILLFGSTAWATHAARAASPADLAYRNGYIYTVDAKNSVEHALAILDGRIVYVGSDSGIESYIGQRTHVVDLHGRMLMPGLVDGHMHPMSGGASLLKCNLNYERLTVDHMQARIQKCLELTRDREPDGWLEVVNWFQEAMLPAGTVTTHAVLDTLRTSRPIFVVSSFGHTALINRRAMQLAGISKDTQDPPNGKIGRDSAGAPSGILDDAAQRLVRRFLPAALPEDNVRAVKAALDAARKQGITSLLDAKATESSLAAFSAVEHAGRLTARAHFGLLILPSEGTEPQKVISRLVDLRQRYDQGATRVEPSMTVRNVKLFLDGVISAPALTGAMLEPYELPSDASANAAWKPSKNRGPEVYFAAPILKALLIAVGRAGFEPHMHADGDRAVREGLDAVAMLRSEFPGRDIRVGMAHDEIVDPADFPRFRKLNVIPVLSFHLAGADYRARLGQDRGLSRQEVLRAITMNSAYELHEDADIGSLEPGKLADLIVLDRNVLEVPEDQIASTKVMQTVVGGRIVYSADRSGQWRWWRPR